MRYKFEPKPGQIDYSKARWAPVINCIVKYGDRILIVQRSRELNYYPNFWSTVDGFLDDQKSLEEKVKEELQEELQLNEDNIISIRLGPIFHIDEPQYKKTWIVHPVLVEVNTDRVSLDWEAQDHRWVKLKEVKDFDLMPGQNIVFEKFFPGA